MSDCIIKLNDLPSRARRIRVDELEDVFGGCGGVWSKCTSNKDCCPGWFCSIGLITGYLSWKWTNDKWCTILGV